MSRVCQLVSSFIPAGEVTVSPQSGVTGITTITNAATVRRLMEEIWGQGRWELVSDLISATYVGHFAAGDHYGPEGARIEIHAYRRAIPDLTVTVDELLALDDKVVRRFTLRGTFSQPVLGIPANCQPVVMSAIAIDQLVHGKLVESWIQVDTLPLLGRTDQHGAK